MFLFHHTNNKLEITVIDKIPQISKDIFILSNFV